MSDEDDDSSSAERPTTGGGTGLYVTQLGPYDVLLGRGTGPSMHEGNVRFRQIVEELKPAYVSTTSRKIKKTLVRRIVSTVKGGNGRFLTKLHKSETKSLGIQSVAYEIVRDSVAFEKTKQAIRYVHYKKEPAAARITTVATQPSDDNTTTTTTTTTRATPRGGTAVLHNMKKEATPTTITTATSTTTSLPISPSAKHSPLLNLRSNLSNVASGPLSASTRDHDSLLFSPNPTTNPNTTTTNLQDLLLMLPGGLSPAIGGVSRSDNQHPTSANMVSLVESIFQNPAAIPTTMGATSYPSAGSTGNNFATPLNPAFERLLSMHPLTSFLSGNARASATSAASATSTSHDRWLATLDEADLKQLLANPRASAAGRTLSSVQVHQTAQLEPQRHLINTTSERMMLPSTASPLDRFAESSYPGQGQRLQPLHNMTQSVSSTASNAPPDSFEQQQEQQRFLQQHQQQRQLLAILQAEDERRRIINSYLASLPPR